MGVWQTRTLLVPVLLIVISPRFSRELSAQTTTSGALAGVVTDQSGAVVPDADVEIKDSAKGATQSSKTGRAGAYQFSFLAPGRYILKVSHSGFREEKRTLDVLLGPAVSVNVTLAIADARSEITVADQVPLIQAENGDASATVNQKQISEVPNPGNDLTYIVQTTPGVVMNTDGPNATGMNFSILGMPSTSYLYSIDGVDNPPTGVLGLMLGQNQVQEVTVVSTGFSGQYGNAAGGNINYVTKSGNNQFHGNAQYFWNGRVFNANNWFNNALGVPRPFDIANQWAGSFGGPIKREKLFFFFDTEGLQVLIPSIAQVLIASPQFQAATIQNIDMRFGATSASHTFYQKLFDLYNSAPGASAAMPGSFVPGDLGCAGPSLVSLLPSDVPCVVHFLANLGTPNQDTLTAGRMDWNAARSDRLFLRFQNTSGHTTLVSPIKSVFDIGKQTKSWQIHAVETHTLSASAANQLLFAYGHINYSSGVADLAKAVATLPTHIFFNPPEQIAEPGGSYQARNSVVQYQVSDDFVRVRQRNKLGFGVNLDRLSSNSSFSADVGFLATTLDAFYQGGADPISPPDSSQLFQSFQSRTRYPVSWYHLGIYGQDEWHARPGLTITMTIRAEHQSNLVCQAHCFARLEGPFNEISHDPNQPYNQAILVNQKRAFQGLDNILWSPRFSFAWQPFGVKHSMVLRGGIGIFYDSVDSVAWNFVGNPSLINSFTVTGDVLSPGEDHSLFTKAADSNAAFVQAFDSGETLAQIKQSIPYFSPPNIIVSEKHTHEPQYQRWSLQLQQAFGTHTSLSVGYFGHHGIHELVQNPSANAWGFGTLPAGRCADPIPDCAPDPRFRQVQQLDTKGISNYNGMVVSVQHLLSGWSQGLFQANYTYGHALDEVSNGGTAPFSNWFRQPFVLGPQDPNDLRGAYGHADYDVRHSFNANYAWELPIRAALGGRGPDFLVKGWQVSGTVFWRTGLPYTVSDIFPPPDLIDKNYFSGLYAVPVRPLGSRPPCGKGAAIPLAPHPCLPTETLWDGITPGPNALFVQPGCETGFDVGRLGAVGVCDGPTVSFRQGRNHFRGPHYFNTDFTIMKSTRISRWESATFRIGFQFFNFFNHPNFGFPVTGIGPPTGLIFYLQQPPTSILGTGPPWAPIDVAPRMIQLKAELKF
jgi:Carboxypeptidase regulatory-like domain/TonB-dependent Receptor Plug Domain